jgi:hypothetical protein
VTSSIAQASLSVDLAKDFLAEFIERLLGIPAWRNRDESARDQA